MLPGEPPRSVEALAEEIANKSTKETPLRRVLKAIATSDRFRRVARPDASENERAAQC